MSDLPYISKGPSSKECLDSGLVCSIDPTTGRCTECGQEEFPPAYYWTGWEDEQEYEPGRPDTHFLTIHTPDGEEYAVIVHRTVDGKFPLDGDVAKGKEKHAQHIVDALNTFNK